MVRSKFWQSHYTSSSVRYVKRKFYAELTTCSDNAIVIQLRILFNVPRTPYRCIRGLYNGIEGPVLWGGRNKRWGWGKRNVANAESRTRKKNLWESERRLKKQIELRREMGEQVKTKKSNHPPSGKIRRVSSRHFFLSIKSNHLRVCIVQPL